MIFRRFFAVVVSAAAVFPHAGHASDRETSPEALEFFEKNVRPIFAEHCHQCHGPEKQKSGLRLDHGSFVMQGGELGLAVVPGQPEESLVYRAVTYADTDLQMPPKKGRLPDASVEAIRRWIELGAPWPDESAASVGDPKEAFDLAERRSRLPWIWQVPKAAPVPGVSAASWPMERADYFILRRLEDEGLAPAGDAPDGTWLRRVYFALIGLPPSPEAIAAFRDDRSAHARETVVDRLLASPRFGERWARHWMDLVRYAESRGHEGDYIIANAYQYRDYLIRAFNADVPYNDFVLEHLAGDLLRDPRRHPETGHNESVLGTGWAFLGEEVHSPVDIRQDETDRVDNKIDVLSKAFLGLTVACARCHDHKFDAITQKDYYALAGFFLSSNYRQVRFETREHHENVSRDLATLDTAGRKRVAAAVAEGYRSNVSQWPVYWGAARRFFLNRGEWMKAVDDPQTVFDFETAEWKGWTAEGAAFGTGPAERKALEKITGPTDALGGRLASSFQPDTSAADGAAEKQLATGVAASSSWTIARPFLRFRIGGGRAEDGVRLELMVDGETVRTAAGSRRHRMEGQVWDLSAWMGRDAMLRLVDEGLGAWGYLSVDEIVASNHPVPAGTTVTPAVFPESWFAEQAAIAESEKIDVASFRDWVAVLIEAWRDSRDVLHVLARMLTVTDETFQAEWRDLAGTLPDGGWRPNLPEGARVIVDFGRATPSHWLTDGPAFGRGPVRPGDLQFGSTAAHPIERVWSVASAQKDPVWDVLRSAEGVERDQARTGGWEMAGRMIRTPKVVVGSGRYHYLVRGSGRVHAVVDSHRMLAGPLHGRLAREWRSNEDRWQWVEHDLSAYTGHRVDMEFVPYHGSDLAIAMVIESSEPPSAPTHLNGRIRRWLEPGAAEVVDFEGLIERYRGEFERTLTLLADDAIGAAADAADVAATADWLVRHPEFAVAKPAAADLLAEFIEERQSIRSRIRPFSRTAPALMDGNGVDEWLLSRGKHQRPQEPVPRALPTAFEFDEATPDEPGSGSGRAELARRLTDASNPLVARVWVNRIWHHLFGRGLVGSVDNFGWLGQRPTHPELLDDLAYSFMHRDQWSTKAIIKRLVLSRTYGMSSRPDDPAAEARDPDNLLLHRMNVQRLEGEVIRDAILAVSGRLDERMFGASIPLHPSQFVVARGLRRERGPLDGEGRRSVYIAARRNFLPMMMLTFDAPIPFTTVGRRTTSNVPGQALVLMNDPFVHEQANFWAERMLESEPDAAETDRIRLLYSRAFSREPSSDEIEACRSALDEIRALREVRGDASEVWSDLCHALLGTKEFIYLN